MENNTERYERIVKLSENDIYKETFSRLHFRIQRTNQLNDIYVTENIGPGNGKHRYQIMRDGTQIAEIQFQEGPRNEECSIAGVLDQDLLEIVRNRLQAFQAGPYATRENAYALTHIEEALMWMAKRADDRAERGVLGTMQK